MDPSDIILIVLAFAAGGLLKGAVGAGAPLLAVPLMALVGDLQFAVAVFVLPNIVPNVWQYWLYRSRISRPRFTTIFAVAGGVGAGLGTIALAGWNPDVLLLGVGLVLVAYILFRLFNPTWVLSNSMSRILALPAGLLAGALQGATGLSAPVSITFLGSLKLPRKEFMATISLFFLALGIVQLPAQFAYGIMTGERLLLSALSLVPLLLAMPVGNWIGQRLPRETFERIILGILGVLAIRLIYAALA
ncbi:sulfite exporter TauE/SafE family protein [Maritimibacter sp. UBA3975]|mgnify:CR=1 FL=1|uniref:sulfite exporter TauE/SafE family protein n=1 Tax=Maritimibacter sp. UBA3975 TaxID=1946833 RepID=UPI000C0B401B|nr:sulfite exporter TauE/SafE family protein [Maritimibacter sp. UBA3975]MAM63174.1 hypothetical protein [Maritimibacter sp.]